MRYLLHVNFQVTGTLWWRIDFCKTCAPLVKEVVFDNSGNKLSEGVVQHSALSAVIYLTPYEAVTVLLACENPPTLYGTRHLVAVFARFLHCS